MGKKCIPGVLCIENMTLFLLFFILVVLVYLYFTTIKQQQQVLQPQVIVLGGMNNLPPQNDSLMPPSMNLAIPNNAIPNNAIPVNIESRGRPSAYTQVGILTREKDLILPLMGRKLTRDKMQYYTISNTGNMNTKLPISKNGKSCTGEYGCDEVFDGDTVFVEGYADTFKATIYENSRFNYIPYL